MDDYSSNEAYWYRRKAVEALILQVSETIPSFKQKKSELLLFNNMIQNRSDAVRYKCVYLFRDGQELNVVDADSRGGYIDTWYRQYQYNLPFVNLDDEDEVPMPGEPVKVDLKPDVDTQSYCTEFIECWHPNCQASPLGKPSVAFMFCSGHASSADVKTIHEFILEGKPIENPEIKTMVEIIGGIIKERVEKSLDQALEKTRETLSNETIPDKVVEVRCYSFLNEEKPDEEITYYIDRVSCIKYKQVDSFN